MHLHEILTSLVHLNYLYTEEGGILDSKSLVEKSNMDTAAVYRRDGHVLTKRAREAGWWAAGVRRVDHGEARGRWSDPIATGIRRV